MARYVSLHTLESPKRSAARKLAARLRSAPGITVRRALLDIAEGRLMIEWQAGDRETIEQWLKNQGFATPEWLELMDYEVIDGQLIIA